MKQLGLFDKLPARDPRELREKFPGMQKWHPLYGYGPHKFKKIPDPYHRIFTPDETQWSGMLGTRMWHKGMNGGYGTRYGEGDSPEALKRSDIQGTRGEIVVCSVEDIAFPVDHLERFKLNDLGPLTGAGICVRCSDYRNPSIIVQQEDQDDAIVVGVAEIVPGREYREHAWAWVREAKQNTPLTNPLVRMPDGTFKDIQKWAHFVRISNNPIVHILDREHPLPAEILKLCPRGYKVWGVR